MRNFLEFMSNVFKGIGNWFSKKKWTDGKSKVVIALVGLMVGIVVATIVMNKNYTENRLSFNLKQIISIPGWKYEELTSPRIQYDEIPNEKKLNVKYDFSYSYLDNNKRNSKAEIYIFCPSKCEPRVLGKNRVESFESKEINGETTEFVFIVDPKAPKNDGYIELELKLYPNEEFDVNINGEAYDKVFLWYGKRYRAGEASHHFRIVKEEAEE